jgi:hypothetical protein
LINGLPSRGRLAVQDWQRDGAVDITIVDENRRQLAFSELAERIKRGA